MKLLEKILVATDFSHSSGHAMNVALFLSKTFHSELNIIHVHGADPLTESESKKLHELTVKELNKTIDDSDYKNLSLSDPFIVSGNPSEQIIKYANKKDVNVIIIGSGEKKDDDRFKLGITVERILRNSRKPVWIVKKNSPSRIKRILCPVDFSDSSERALRNAVHLARHLKAELEIVHVIKYSPRLYLGRKEIKNVEKEKYKNLINIEFDKLVKKLDFVDVEYKLRLLEGDPHIKILDHLKDQRFDLLVMGTVGKSGFEKILIGSVAEKVIREVPCSALMIREESPIRLKLEDEIENLDMSMILGKEMLKNGFAEEALNQFKNCISIDKLYAPAWEALSLAYKRLNLPGEAKIALENAKEIRQKLWERQVEFEVKKQYKPDS